MTRKSVQILAAAVVGLLLLLVVVQRGDRFETLPADQLMLPGFASHANDVRRIDIQRPDDEPPITIQLTDGEWSVSARDGYPADFGKLSKLIIALAEATTVEEKTSNPERYAALGVDDPSEGGSGTRVTLTGDGFSYAVVLGDEARGDFRYARVADDATSYLVNQDLSIPDDVTGWLKPDIIDIALQRVRRVTISHADGERVVVEKEAQDSTNFSVLDVPEGRELSYDTVGNSIGGALSNLELEDVRAAVDGEAVTTVDFDTWQGLSVTVALLSEDDADWLSLSATTSADDADADDPENTNDPETGRDVLSEADSINDRLSGWQFRIADFKKNTLTRRWEDLLKASQ